MTTLSDVTDLIVDSEHKTAPKAETGYPLVRTSDIKRGRIDLSNVQRVDEDTYTKWTRRAEPQPGDLILAREAPVGNVAVVTGGMRPVLGQRTVLLRPNPALVDSTYLCALLLGDQAQYRMNAVANGATVPHLNMSDIRGMQLQKLPTLDTQRRTGRAIATFDDLIENNRRRIEILEEMARLLYREWFVHFRFPVHEDVEMVDSELGPIPEGWEAMRLGEYASYINRGIAPKYSDESEDVVINQRCIRDGRLTLDKARTHVKKVPADKVVQEGDVLINSTGVGTLGRVAPVREAIKRATVDSHVTIVRPPTDEDPDFFAELLLAMQPVFEKMGAGSTGQTELSRARVGELSVVRPAGELTTKFGRQIKPMRLLHINLTRQNTVLREARDLLLPRLVSGELDVSDLDLHIEPTEVAEATNDTTGASVQ